MAKEWSALCGFAIGAIALYVTLFVFAVRPVSVRFNRLANILLLVIVVRAGIIVAGIPFEPMVDASLAAIAIGLLISRRQMRRAWFIRTTSEEFRQRIATSCRGLFLAYEESGGRFVFSAGETTSQLRLYSIGKRLQFIVLPPAGCHGKVTLLTGWLAKQFPGPIPRIKIVLKRR